MERHPRYAGFGTKDWRRVSGILDQGEWLARPDDHRLLWIDEDGKPWVAVVKRTANAEVYLQASRMRYAGKPATSRPPRTKAAPR